MPLVSTFSVLSLNEHLTDIGRVDQVRQIGFEKMDLQANQVFWQRCLDGEVCNLRDITAAAELLPKIKLVAAAYATAAETP
jgi:hypothetical protein